MALHLSLPGTRPADPVLRQFDVVGPPGLSGKALADALADEAPGIRWHAGNRPLSEVPGLPSHGHLLLTPAASNRPVPSAPAPVWLLVEEGPDCGAARPLPRGTHRIGRHNCDITVADPAVSRHAADLVVDGRSITLREHRAGSGRPAGTPPPMAVGDRFRLGSTTFRIAARERRVPAAGWPLPPLCVHGFSGTGRPAVALLGAILPLLIGAGLVAATGSWLFLAFGALGLATGGIPAAADLRARRRFGKRWRAAAEQDRERLETVAPPLGTLVLDLTESVHAPAGNEPARAADALPLRIGRGDATANVEVAGGPAPPPVRLDACPVVVGVRTGSVGAVTGTPAAAASTLRALVFRLAVAVHDAGWQLLLAGPATAFPASLRRHPHIAQVRSPDDLARLPRSSAPAVVVLTAPSPQWLVPCLALAGEQRIALIALDPDADLPAQWRVCPDAGWLEERNEPRSSDPGRAEPRRAAPSPTEPGPPGPRGAQPLPAARRRVAVDGMSFRTLDEACRSTAPDGPGPLVRHSDTPGMDVAVAPAGGPGRGSSASSLLVQLGRREEWPGGDLHLDLVADGPHLLVAGTTGSGKSELLKTLLLGLAAIYPPAELAFLLADFKGGATFSAFRPLPHVQGLITDLDAETARRTLESLRAELVRRERLLAAWGAADYVAYRCLADPQVPLLPRLVAVVDEFRVLSDDVPEALAELARLAAVGRSLGVHLVLATQRPQGSVTADLRANLNAVACLRVLAPFDSVDLLGTADAAEIPVDEPGRAYLRRGGERPVRFQVRRSGTAVPEWLLVEVGPDLDTRGQPRRIPALRDRPAARDTAASDEAAASLPARPARAPSAGAQSADSFGRRGSAGAGTDRTSDAVADLVRSLAAVDRPPSPFAPPLPDALDSIPRRFLPTAGAPAAVPLGIADPVGKQRLELFAWSPRPQRRMALVGGPSGGGTAAVRRLVEGAARMEPECHIYVLDGSLACPEAAGLPRVACYIDPSDPERVSGMLDLLEEASGGGVPAADRVLVLTGLAAWAAVLGPAGMPRFEDRLTGLARSPDGPSVVAAGDRDLVSSRFFALAEHRLYLPFGLGPETTVLWPRLRKVRSVPGRAVWTGPGIPDDGVAVQLLGPLPAGAADGRPAPPARLPMAVSRPLPRLVSGGDLRRVARPAVPGPAPREAPRNYLLGVIGPDNRPWHWGPGRVGMVLGRPGSGKTAALRFIQGGLGPEAVWVDPTEGSEDRPSGASPSRATPGSRSVAGHVDARRPSEGQEPPSQTPCPESLIPPVVLVDDAADLSAEQRARVEQWHRAGSRVVLAAVPGPRLFVDFPLAAVARAAESVLVLNPRSPTDADVVGWRVEPLPRDIPGRGVVIVAGVQRQVQCALP